MRPEAGHHMTQPPADDHALNPIRPSLYTVQVLCACGWASDVWTSEDRAGAWADAVRHIASFCGPDF